MSKSNGFLQLRRGIWEHVRDGSLTHVGALVYIYMLTQADTRTGIWKGSAQCLASALNIPKSTAKYVLRGLDGKYIRRFTVPGRHVCYPILLHKFLITQGQHIGLMLDALNSTDERTLEFYKPQDEQHIVEQVVQHVAPQRIRDKREQIKNLAAKPAADPRHKIVFDSCCEAYRTHYGVEPTWGSREGSALKRFLMEHASIPAEQVTRRYKNFLNTRERYHAEKHGSLCHLLGNFDTFADGPVPERINGNAKPRVSADQRTRDNLRAAGLLN